MARVSDLLAAGRTYSFEFFPPKTDGAQLSLGHTIAELEPLAPSFVSVTYGAGGSTRSRTHAIVSWVRRETSITPMAHLTCQGHTRAEVAEILDGYRAEGIENVLALGGDPPDDPGDHRPSDYRYASDLLEDIGAADFSIGVAAHPEVHPRSPDRATDRRLLAAKLSRADFAITQFFFEAEHYHRLVDELAALGCDTPLIPGVMPFVSVAGTRRMAAVNGCHIPDELQARMDAVDGDPESVRRLGVEVATALCEDLLDHDVRGLHLYAMNRSTSIREVYAGIGW